MIRPGSEQARLIRIFICLMIMGSSFISQAQADDLTQLQGLVTSFEDPKMSADDLAFYLITHNYNARPMDGYVQVQLNGAQYRLVPNGDGPGLCDISQIT